MNVCFEAHSLTPKPLPCFFALFGVQQEVESRTVPCRGGNGASSSNNPEGSKMAEHKGVRFNDTAMDSQDAEWYNILEDGGTKICSQTCHPACMNTITPKERYKTRRKRKFSIIEKFGVRFRHNFQHKLI